MKREEGATLIEALMAIVVLVVGVIGTFSTFDGITRLGMFGEKKQAATRYIQGELEQVRNQGWSNVKLSAAPAIVSNSRGTATAATYAPPNSGAAQNLLIAATPASCTSTTCVNPGPENWTYGTASGQVFRYVTSSHDDACGSACPAGTIDHVRVTIAVTINGPNAPKVALVSSTVLIDPAAAPANATQNANPVVSTGGNSISATASTYYFSDTPWGQSYAAPASAHSTRDTVGVTGVPDQLRTETPSPPGSGAQTALSYSTDVPPRADGGLGLAASAGCNGTTSTTSHRWVTPVINASAVVTATGNAALSMPTSLLDADVAAGAPGRLCVSIYSVTLNASNQVSSSTLLGSDDYQLADWPETTEMISYAFRYLPANTTSSIAAGRRLMVEIKAHGGYSTGLALVYDHPNFPASIQLETQ